MFSREDLECLDPGYFEIIYMDDRDVTIMSRNTRDGGRDDAEGCGAAWRCADPGVVFCYGEVA